MAPAARARRKKGAAPDDTEAGNTPASIDELLDRLDAIVADLEGGDLPLEEALARFHEGMQLVRKGRKALDELETRIEVLLEDGGTEPLDPADVTEDTETE